MLKARVDDGYHRQKIEIDEDGDTTHFYVTCACGNMKRVPCESYEQSDAGYTGHLRDTIRARTPRKISLGVRTGLLVASMVVTWMWFSVLGMVIADLTGGFVSSVIITVFHGLGGALAILLMMFSAEYVDPYSP